MDVLLKLEVSSTGQEAPAIFICPFSPETRSVSQFELLRFSHESVYAVGALCINNKTWCLSLKDHIILS